MRQSTQNGHVQTEDSGSMRVDMQSEKQKYEHSTRNDQHYKDFQQIHYPLLKVNLAVGVLRKCESWRHRPQAAHSLKYLHILLVTTNESMEAKHLWREAGHVPHVTGLKQALAKECSICVKTCSVPS